MSRPFKRIVVGRPRTNCYIFCAGETCVVIDPGDSDRRITNAVRDLTPSTKAIHILLTHAHVDHFYGVDYLFRCFPRSTLYVSEIDKPALYDPVLNVSSWVERGFVLQQTDGIETVRDGTVLKFGSIDIRVTATPGHTTGGVVFVIDSLKAVFTGDTVFARKFGRVDFPGGDESVVRQSIAEKILVLPGDYTLYPGHFGLATVSEIQEWF
jgi:glyoxylase-like metal-dependent hydrolase (beta-lactamase superfamily II)